MDISRFPSPPSPWPARVVRDLEVLGLTVAIGFCVWLGGSLLGELGGAQPSDTRQLLNDRVQVGAPSPAIDAAALDVRVDLRETEISQDPY